MPYKMGMTFDEITIKTPDLPAVNALDKDHFLQLAAAQVIQILQSHPHFMKDGKAPEIDTIYQALKEREALSSTALGQGLALPHARIKGLTKLFGFLMPIRPAIAYDVPDNQAVDLAYILIAPDDLFGDHIRAMSTIVLWLKDSAHTAALRGGTA